MNKQQLEERIKDMKVAIEQSSANHHALVGRLTEAMFMLEEMEKVSCQKAEEAVVEA